MSMEWSCQGFTLTFQETRSIHDSMNRPKSNLLPIFRKQNGFAYKMLYFLFFLDLQHLEAKNSNRLTLRPVTV